MKFDNIVTFYELSHDSTFIAIVHVNKHVLLQWIILHFITNVYSSPLAAYTLGIQ